MDWSLVEAAQDLGDSPFRAFRRITLPLALPGILAGSLLVFIPLTGEYIIPVILGGNKTFYAGNLIAQQFLESGDWPLGSAIAMVVIGALTIALLDLCARARQAGAVRMTGRRVLGGYALLVYVFLYAPILVVVVVRVQRGTRRPLLGGVLDEVVRGRPEHAGDHRSAPAQRADRARERGRRLRARDDARARAAAYADFAAHADRRARVHDARHAGDRLRDRRARLLRAGGRQTRPRQPARLADDSHRPRRLQRLGRRARRARSLRLDGPEPRGGLVRSRRRAARARSAR